MIVIPFTVLVSQVETLLLSEPRPTTETEIDERIDLAQALVEAHGWTLARYRDALVLGFDPRTCS
jgi:hypothetical protein